MNKMKKGFLAVLVGFLVFFAGCVEQNTESKNEIRIGVVAPLTGSASTTGTDMWQAAVLAAEEINANGGVVVNGTPYTLVLVKGDDESSPEAGNKAVTKLITEDNVDLLVGGFSSSITYVMSKVAAENKVPFIITGASSPVVTRRTDIDTSYFFHHCPTSDDLPDAMLLSVNDVVAPEIYEKFNLSGDRPLRLALLLQDSKYGEGILAGVNASITARKLNIEIVAIEKFKMGETDYRAALTALKAAKPDVVYAAAFVNEQSLIVVQGRRDVGLNTLYLAVDCNDDPAYYTSTERWGEYSVVESRFGPYAVPSGAVQDAFIKYKTDFAARWNTAPGMMGASTYDGLYVGIAAIQKAGSLDKAKIRDALESIELPQRVEPMRDGVTKFSADYHEAKFDLFVEQLSWDDSVGECRSKIVWPSALKETDFVLPGWYQPGSA